MKNQLKKVGAAAAVLPVLLVSKAHAALPTAATAALTEIGTGVDDTETAIWPIIGAVLVAFTIIKLVKRGVSKV